MVEFDGRKYHLCAFGDTCWYGGVYDDDDNDVSKCTSLLLANAFVIHDVTPEWEKMPNVSTVRFDSYNHTSEQAALIIQYYMKYIHPTNKKFDLGLYGKGVYCIEDVFQLQELLLSTIEEDQS